MARKNQLTINIVLVISILLSIQSNIFSQSIDSLESILRTDLEDTMRAAVYVQLSETYQKSDLDQAQLYLDSARLIKAYNRLSHNNLKVLFLQGSIHERRQSFDTARVNFENVLQLQNEKITDSFLVGNTYYKLGNMSRRQGNNEDAIKYLNQSKEIFFALKKPDRAASSDVVLGIIYKNTKQYEKAIEYYTSAWKEYNRTNNYDAMATCVLNIANVYGRQGLHHAALDKYEEALQLAKKLKRNEGLLAFVYGNQANAYQQLKIPDKAYEANSKAYELRKMKAPPEELVNSQIGMANSLRRLNRYGEAIKMLKAAEELSRSTDGMLTAQMRIKECYIKIHEDKNQTKLAFVALKDFVRLKDSIYNLEVDKQVLALNEQLETARKENEIVVLNTQNEITQAKLVGARRRNIGLGIGLLLFGLLLWNLYRLFKKTEFQNQIITKALKEKGVLLQEIHHRVKNNLQFISSLLGLQTDYVKDQTALNALQEGQDRVHSMALIHQNLYQENNLTGVNVHDYFVKLIRNLFDSYNIRPDKIKLSLDIEDLNLDVDSVVPIGLIVNELISNSLKYAFPDNQSGSINVSLIETNEQLVLKVIDDGIGIPDDQKNKMGESFGYKLVSMLNDQLEAKLDIRGDNGTEVELKIGKYRLAA